MPGRDGRMNDAEYSAVISQLDKNWTEVRACPIFGGNNWLVHPYVTVAANYTGSSGQYVGTSFPVVIVYCGDCGYSVQFLATLLGLYVVGGEVQSG